MMYKLKKSKLRLVDFSMMNSTIALPPPPDDLPEEMHTDYSLLLDKYELEADFMVARRGEQENTYSIYVKIGINADEKEPGYVIFAEGMGVFNINADEVGEEELHELINTGVSIVFSNIRSYIMLSTSTYPLGQYILPLFDLSHLVAEKATMAETENNKKQKKSPKKLKK